MPAARRSLRGASPRAALRAQPWRFGFDAAVRVLAGRRDPADAIRFRTPPGLAFPAADVVGLDEPAQSPPKLTVTVMGLTGPSGVMPRTYTATLTQSLRARSRALHDFADMLGHRFVAFFARAGTKYRPARAAEAAPASELDPVSQSVLALIGYGTPFLAPRVAAGQSALLHYAGLFAMRPRSADRLAALASDWLGMRVEVIEFAGAWLSLPPDQRTRLSANPLRATFCRLAVDAAIGVRAWDSQARFTLAHRPAKPSGLRGDAAGSAGATPLGCPGPGVCRVRAGLCRQSRAGGGRRYHDCVWILRPTRRQGSAGMLWLPTAELVPRADAADAVFEAELVEAQQLARGQGR